MRARTRRLATLLLLPGLLALGGCGGSREASTARALKLSREDLVVVCRALERAAGQAAVEVAASKRAWRLMAHGLPRAIPASAPPAIAAAAASAAHVIVPAPLQEAQARTLTGPAAEIAGLFSSYALLAARGWRLLGAAVAAIAHGPPAVAAFARQNAALYIESVYDAHFTLAQIGKKVRAAYAKLGGAAAFGAALPAAQVRALEAAYSEASDRLHPHAGVRLGS